MLLDGQWKFQLDPTGSADPKSLSWDRTIQVPLPWQAAFPELRTYSGYAWYQRDFEIAPEFLTGEVRLSFGAVDYWCQVFVNDVLIGEHEGGYTPFSFAVRPHLQPGTNRVTVWVFDPVQEELRFPRWPSQSCDGPEPRFTASEVPHGKQEWYANVGGIWQSVTLEAVPHAWLETLHITPNLEEQVAAFSIQLAGALDSLPGTGLVLTILDGTTMVAEQRLECTRGVGTVQAVLPVPQPHLWSLEDPHLYTAIARLEGAASAAGETHERIVRFGMRSFTTRAGQFLLNGQPVYLLAALDQDFYPETIYTVPSEETLRDEFRKVKELGLNTLRCHIKIPDPLYLDLADEMGLLVWEEIPSWRTIYPKGSLDTRRMEVPVALRARVETTLREMVARDYNHPSVVIRTLVNEDWGTSLPLSAADRAWVAGLYTESKRLDPTRLVVDNSPCLAAWGPNVHVHSDIDDYHIYANIPDQGRSFTQAVRQLAYRPLWTYSSQGDSRRAGDEPLVLSEFGSWGLPALSTLSRGAGEDGPEGHDHANGRTDGHSDGHPNGKSTEPAWFQVTPWGSSVWDSEMGSPPGVAQRFRDLGLQAIWPGYDTFAWATQWHQYRAFKYQIEAVRREPNLAGYVITELTDIYWESNGLLDFERNPKAYHHAFRLFNSPDVILPTVEQASGWSGDPVRIALHLSHYSGRGERGARLSWKAEGFDLEGSWDVPGTRRGSAGLAHSFSVLLPEVEQAQTLRLCFSWDGASGSPIAANTLDLVVYPRTARLAPPVGVVAVPGGEAEPVFGLQPDQLSECSVEETAPPGTPAAAPRENPGFKEALAVELENLGYTTTRRLTPEIKLAVSDAPTRELLRWVRQGGSLLYLSDGLGPFFWSQGRGGSYSGSWITSYSWVRPEVHRRLKVENPLGMQFQESMPRHAILGLPFEEAMAQGDVLAGMVVGWVHHPAAYTVQFRYGKGRVIMTTFLLRHTLGWDPAGTVLLHDLVEHLNSADCQPQLQANY